MKKGLALITAAGAGAGLMYLFDPNRGKRRRALLRNKAVHLKNVTADVFGKTQRDLRNRVGGVVAELESLWADNGPVDNEVLEARVRSTLGHVVAHPRAIEVQAVDGLIILKGQIPAKEVHPLLDSVSATRGVKNIESYLDAREM